MLSWLIIESARLIHRQMEVTSRLTEVISFLHSKKQQMFIKLTKLSIITIKIFDNRFQCTQYLEKCSCIFRNLFIFGICRRICKNKITFSVRSFRKFFRVAFIFASNIYTEISVTIPINSVTQEN